MFGRAVGTPGPRRLRLPLLLETLLLVEGTGELALLVGGVALGVGVHDGEVVGRGARRDEVRQLFVCARRRRVVGRRDARRAGQGVGRAVADPMGGDARLGRELGELPEMGALAGLREGGAVAAPFGQRSPGRDERLRARRGGRDAPAGDLPARGHREPRVHRAGGSGGGDRHEVRHRPRRAEPGEVGCDRLIQLIPAQPAGQDEDHSGLRCRFALAGRGRRGAAVAPCRREGGESGEDQAAQEEEQESGQAADRPPHAAGRCKR